MGMFDSFYDEAGREWQTKAYDCNLDEYQIGDTIPADSAASYQVEILHGAGHWPDRTHIDSLATIRSGVLASIDDKRDPTLPLIDYGGRFTPESTEAPRAEA